VTTPEATPTDVLDVGAVEAIAHLCVRGLERPPTASELAGALFAPDQPAVVRGDPSVGVVATVATDAGGNVRLLVVDPSGQGHGHGGRLLHAAEQDLRAGRAQATTVTVGADPPYYLFPGVETSQTAMLCLLEKRRYQRHEANFNMDVDLRTLPPEPAATGSGPRLAKASDRGEVDGWMAANWDNWRPEALRALDQGTLVIDRDDDGLTGICAYDVNRAGLVGPVAVRLDLIGKGRGEPLLLNALHRLRAAGNDRTEVSWVGPIGPYARVGATIGRVFFVFRKTFKPRSEATT
jgi:N-acetylglutamate synthase-like GNAT family acetyltransferase